MSVRYIGRKTDFSGKPLWEILGNLKNFGVGRLVKRHMFDRYPEPSFLRIVIVDTVPTVEGEDRKVRAWVEKVFRGQRYPELVELYSTTYKADYRLIPKSEEEELWRRVNAIPRQEKLLPQYIPFPPLLAEMIKEDLQKSGQPVEEPMLRLIVKNHRDNFYKIAADNETPTVQFNNQAASPQLYKLQQ